MPYCGTFGCSCCTCQVCMRWHDACVCELRKRTDQLIIQQPEPAYGQDDEWIDEVVTLLKDWRGR